MLPLPLINLGGRDQLFAAISYITRDVPSTLYPTDSIRRKCVEGKIYNLSDLSRSSLLVDGDLRLCRQENLGGLVGKP